MLLFHILLYIHIFAAIVMIGISIANGFGKTLADRTRNVQRMTFALELTIYFNKVLMLPSLVFLALSGLSLTFIMHLPFSRGWILQSIIILFIFFVLYFVGNHYEHRLYNIVKHSGENNHKIVSDRYWKESKKYNFIGFLVIIAILLILYLMVFQKSIF